MILTLLCGGYYLFIYFEDLKSTSRQQGKSFNDINVFIDKVLFIRQSDKKRQIRIDPSFTYTKSRVSEKEREREGGGEREKKRKRERDLLTIFFIHKWS